MEQFFMMQKYIVGGSVHTAIFYGTFFFVQYGEVKYRFGKVKPKITLVFWAMEEANTTNEDSLMPCLAFTNT